MSDPAYHNAGDGRGFNRHVFLDGVEVKYVVDCNTREGWLSRHLQDANGGFRISGDSFVTERLRGHVRVARFE